MGGRRDSTGWWGPRIRHRLRKAWGWGGGAAHGTADAPDGGDRAVACPGDGRCAQAQFDQLRPASRPLGPLSDAPAPTFRRRAEPTRPASRPRRGRRFPRVGAERFEARASTPAEPCRIAGLEAYNAWIQLSLLQKIYHFQSLRVLSRQTHQALQSRSVARDQAVANGLRRRPGRPLSRGCLVLLCLCVLSLFIYDYHFFITIVINIAITITIINLINYYYYQH